jgi:hypothetical protein
VVEGGESLRLAAESLQLRLATGHFGRQYLERHLPLEGRVFGAIHLSHAARTELVENLVVADALADHDLPRALILPRRVS